MNGRDESNAARETIGRRGILRATAGLGTGIGAGCIWPRESETPPDHRSLFGLVPVELGEEMDGIANVESWVGTSPAVVTEFVGHIDSNEEVDRFLDERLTPLWERGHVPLVTWEPYMTARPDDDRNIAQLIANGEYGHEIGEWAWKLSEWVRGGEQEGDRRLYMRFAHEMNADWYPWGSGVTPGEYVDMWRSVHDAFESLPFDRHTLQWMWAPNSDDFGEHAAEEYYPGDEYVDWIGIDGYNFGDEMPETGWRGPEAVFRPMLERLRSIADKPIAFPEFASGSYRNGRHRPEDKDDWIRNVYALIREMDVKMHCWFDQDKETDWAVFGGERGTTVREIDDTEYPAYEAYEKAISSLQSIDREGERMTDDVFRGAF